MPECQPAGWRRSCHTTRQPTQADRKVPLWVAPHERPPAEAADIPERQMPVSGYGVCDREMMRQEQEREVSHERCGSPRFAWSTLGRRPSTIKPDGKRDQFARNRPDQARPAPRWGPPSWAPIAGENGSSSDRDSYRAKAESWVLALVVSRRGSSIFEFIV